MNVSLIYERDVMIPTREGELGANVYRPLGEGQFPVILTCGPYGKDRNWADRDQEQARDFGGGPFINWETPDPETWVPKGFAVLRVDNRGTGSSPGYLNPLAADNAENYYDAIEWAAEQPWSTGKVGLLGVSFYAMTQWLVAARRPPHLAAMIPWEAAADMYRDFMRAGGIVNAGFLSWWWPETVLNAQHGGDGLVGEEERRQNRLESMIDAVLERPLDQPFYSEWTDLSEIDVPFLSVGNWGNIGLHLRGNTEAFVNAASEQKWLRIITGDHFHPFYAPENVALQERFLDHFLKGEDNGWDREPRVQLAIRDRDEVTWRGESEWPIGRTAWTEVYLDGGDMSLLPEPPDATAEASFAALEETLTFTTAPFDAETEITGPAALRLRISSSTSDADLFVRLGRIDPDGTDVMGIAPDTKRPAIALAEGWLRASHRKLDPERSLPYRPYHTHDEEQPLRPGEPEDVQVEIWPTSIIFPVGSRMILEVGGKDMPTTFFLHGDERDRPATVFGGTTTIYTGPAIDSALVLPVIPDREDRPDL